METEILRREEGLEGGGGGGGMGDIERKAG